MISRRHFIGTSLGVSAGFLGLRRLTHAHRDRVVDPHGPLVHDPKKIFDLPKGFSYRVISRAGDEMDDGLLVPGRMDGMGAFAGPGGETILVRNHELHPNFSTDAFGAEYARIDQAPRERFYDFGGGETPSTGGTTTLVYDTRSGKRLREYQSLFGTLRNCAGGVTPWGTWISCEETVNRAGRHPMHQYLCEKEHGYNFEVPAEGRASPEPLVEMGRFNHEAVAVHEPSGIVYQTEDRHEGLFYRFLPDRPGELSAGGSLQALVVEGEPGYDTRNWIELPNRTEPSEVLTARWVDLEDVTAPKDDLRFRGHRDGAARFARGEGIWAAANGDIYFVCTSGGLFKNGQVWRYTPSPDEGGEAEAKSPGRLELFIEPNRKAIVHNADNLTVAPWGDLILCEDRTGDVIRLVGVTPAGECYTLGHCAAGGEIAGACFSADGSTLFINLQIAGLTLAITGPWPT